MSPHIPSLLPPHPSACSRLMGRAEAPAGAPWLPPNNLAHSHAPACIPPASENTGLSSYQGGASPCDPGRLPLPHRCPQVRAWTPIPILSSPEASLHINPPFPVPSHAPHLLACPIIKHYAQVCTILKSSFLEHITLSIKALNLLSLPVFLK